ncbi:MAG TPA: hypothetical protein DCQ06_04455 [Myxococcales bacterium]|nr:hypothetical protein [Myxococcales bacterium]HAN30828.1 hypothetical protein [Myxococcales bacterium]
MNAALIDLHVRATEDPLSAAFLLEQASTKGLDGLVLVGQGQAPQIEDAEDVRKAIYVGVEVDTDIGRLLCLPSTIDEWFTESKWNELTQGEQGLNAVEVAKEFTERGGVVMVAQPFDRDLGHPCLEDAFQSLDTLSAVVVTSSPKHTASNERASKAAVEAKLPGAGGSASTIRGERFGSVATLFPRHPVDQQALVAGVKSGRMWPVEMTVLPPREVIKTNSNAEGKSKRRQKKSKDDNRGNRVDLAKLSKPQSTEKLDKQPEYDPIAKLYGLHKRNDRLGQHRSDAELDRVNGNRSSGHDCNVMVSPDFRELQAERQHVNLLLQTIDGQRQQDRDSIALRFAVVALGRDANDNEIDFEAIEAASIDPSRNRKRRRRRR